MIDIRKFCHSDQGSYRVFCYQYEPSPVDRNTAYRKCKLNGASLLYFENSDETVYFENAPIWLGINNVNKRRENIFRKWYVDKNYRWETSKEISFENWSTDAIRLVQNVIIYYCY